MLSILRRRTLSPTLFLLASSVAVIADPAVPDQELSVEVLKASNVPVVRPPPAKPRPIIVQPAPLPDPNTLYSGLDIVSTPVIGVTESVRPIAPMKPGDKLRLDLATYVTLVRQRNNRILSQRLEWLVADESVKNAQSIFEMEFVGSSQHEENQVRNTVQEQLQRSSVGQFNEYNEHYNGGVEGALPTGGRVRTFYRLDDFNNNLQPLRGAAGGGPDTFNEFRTFIGTTLSQPLLRNRGEKVAKAKIHVAEKDKDIAFQTYRKEMMRICNEAVSAYYELVASQQNLEHQQQSTALVTQILESVRRRQQSGLGTESDVIEAEAAVAQRRSQQQTGEQTLANAKARVRNYIAESPENVATTMIDATDDLVVDAVNTDINLSLRAATRLAPDYLAAKSKAEREGIRLAYAKNQTWPQLDMSGSYGVNGLAANPNDSFTDAFNSGNRSWNVLLEMRLPLDGGKRVHSELRAAEYRKMQSLSDIKAIEVELSNGIYASIQSLQAARIQLEHLREVTSRNQKLLEVEIQRLGQGFTTLRQALQREEDVRRARDEELRALLNYKRSFLDLELTRGTILERFGGEIPATAGPFVPVTQAKK